jgi:hypothetical protein
MSRCLASGLAFTTFVAMAGDMANAACSGTLYLTFDTGNMRHAELIAETLAKHRARATFFVANEKTLRGDLALDLAWAPYWHARRRGSRLRQPYLATRQLPPGSGQADPVPPDGRQDRATRQHCHLQ